MSTAENVLAVYPAYEAVIGIEVHVQVSTASKIFCGSANGPQETPNVSIDPVCAGYPGVLPVLNNAVVEAAVMAGLATQSTIASRSTFARKHYFYPDLPKGYQISQHEEPICSNGRIPVRLPDGSQIDVRLTRIHMEEDAGKNIHAEGQAYSLVDLNRAGSPLLEIVSEPDMRSPEEAKAYLKTLHSIVTYLGICSGNMEEGAFRADTNVSVRKKGDTKLGTRCELKNINSFKFIGDAINYEIERQIQLLEAGERVIQQTRLWDVKQHRTYVMREKEDAADYRYFPDPDLPVVVVKQEMVNAIRARMPELPYEKHERLKQQYGLSDYEAEILINDPAVAAYFEAAAAQHTSPLLIHWILRDVLGYLKEHKITLAECKMSAHALADLIRLLDTNVVNARTARDVFEICMAEGGMPAAVVQERGLQQVDNRAEIEALIAQLLAEHPAAVADYKAGKEKLFGFFVGKVMAATKGKANPATINDLLKKALAA